MLGNKALFVGYGYGESQRFRELAAFLGGESTLLLGEGRPFADPQIPEAVRASDVVFISMSETSPLEVNAARAAIELGKPFFLFAFHYYREEFADVIPQAKAIFVIDKGEAHGLLAKYPKANVVIMGEIGIEGAHKPPYTREHGIR